MTKGMSVRSRSGNGLRWGPREQSAPGDGKRGMKRKWFTHKKKLEKLIRKIGRRARRKIEIMHRVEKKTLLMSEASPSDHSRFSPAHEESQVHGRGFCCQRIKEADSLVESVVYYQV